MHTSLTIYEKKGLLHRNAETTTSMLSSFRVSYWVQNTVGPLSMCILL